MNRPITVGVNQERAMRVILAACAAIAFAGSAQAITVINGSFETGINPAGSTLLATGDATSLPGWTVLAQGIDYVDNSVWAASRGDRSLDLSGLNRGGITQRISGFTVGQRYRLQVDVSANPFDPSARPKEKRLLISTSMATPTVFVYNLTDANTASAMQYQTLSYEFVAGRVTQGFTLASLMQNEYGVVIDNVRISAVPEPGAWFMLCAGLALVGASLRRRGAVAVVTA